MEEENKQEEVVSTTTNKVEKKNLNIFLLSMLGFVGAIVVIVAVFGLVRVYAQNATDQFTYTVAKILHLPAFKVGETSVPYSNYIEDYKALDHLRNYEKTNNVANAVYASSTDSQIQEEVIYRLVDNVLVEQSAKKFGLKVTDDDIATSKAQILQNFSTTAEAESEIKSRFGWSLDEYVNKVAYPYNLRVKLSYSLASSTEFDKETYNEADKVLNEIKNGADFATMAKKYGNDGTASSGGDLGWFTSGAMVPEFETAVFALKKGELDDELVKTEYGYHIVKLTDVRTSTAKDSSGKDVTQTEYRASHIIFPIGDINYYLDQKLETTKLHWYLRITNPIKKYLEKKNSVS